MGNTQGKTFRFDDIYHSRSSKQKSGIAEQKRRIIQSARARVVLDEESSESELDDCEEIWTPNVNVSANFIDQFCALAGNDFFCEVDKSFCVNPFNLVGLREKKIPNFDHALNLILDSENYRRRKDFLGDTRKLYGLIHARYILTPLGQAKMIRKMIVGDFGVCIGAACKNRNYLPIGLSDEFGIDDVKLYCPQCQGINECLKTIDGAFFGKSFPHLLMMTNPRVFPEESGHIYVPRLFGFKVNEKAYAIQEKKRREAEEQAKESMERHLKDSLVKKDAELLERKAKEDAMEEEFEAAIDEGMPKEAWKEALEKERQSPKMDNEKEATQMGEEVSAQKELSEEQGKESMERRLRESLARKEAELLEMKAKLEKATQRPL